MPVTMSFLRILWDDPHDPGGNVQHIAEHGLDIDDVEEVLSSPSSRGVSDSSGCPLCGGIPWKAYTSSSFTNGSTRTPFALSRHTRFPNLKGGNHD